MIPSFQRRTKIADYALESFDLNVAIQRARREYESGAGTVLDCLLHAGNDEVLLRKRLPAEHGVEILDVSVVEPEFDILDRAHSKSFRCVLLRPPGGKCRWLAAEDPWDEALLQKMSRRAGVTLSPVAATTADLERWFGSASALTEPTADTSPAPPVSISSTSHAADGPIVAFVDTAIRAASETGTSDIHFECDRQGVTVKHRLDGVMGRFARLEGVQQAEEVISRIKVLAQLDITERRLPQDGRFRIALQNESIDLRVSIMPSVFGEDAVLRLLDKAQLRAHDSAVSLDALGLDAHNAQLIRELSAQPSGMLLMTGPTGSGKTTTVYAALSEINTGREKIITIEDPVEYELPGVLQIPVNERKGLTFARGLRSILRHDPDRILVGEIRDAETAEIAVQSALTGHLVFTTVHANGVADVMGRFRHFGLDMFGFMSSLNGVVVQRLVRRLCAECFAWRDASPRESAWLVHNHAPSSAMVPVANGCGRCRGSGYRGRFVVAEVHVIDDVFRDHVTEGAPVSVLKRHAYESGLKTLATQAAERVGTGETTMEEVKRVVGWL